MVLLGILFACLAPVALVGWGFVWLVNRVTASSETRGIALGWSATARAIGCTYVPKSGTIEGALDGASVKVDRFTVSASAAGTIGQTSHVTFTRVVASANGLPAAFNASIAKAGIVGAVAKALGGQDVVVGQPEFDRTFMVRSNEPALLPRMIGPELAALLLSVSSIDITIRDGVVIATHGGVVTDASFLVPMVRAAASLATSAAAAASTAAPAYRG